MCFEMHLFQTQQTAVIKDNMFINWVLPLQLYVSMWFLLNFDSDTSYTIAHSNVTGELLADLV